MQVWIVHGGSGYIPVVLLGLRLIRARTDQRALTTSLTLIPEHLSTNFVLDRQIIMKAGASVVENADAASKAAESYRQCGVLRD